MAHQIESLHFVAVYLQFDSACFSFRVQSHLAKVPSVKERTEIVSIGQVFGGKCHDPLKYSRQGRIDNITDSKKEQYREQNATVTSCDTELDIPAISGYSLCSRLSNRVINNWLRFSMQDDPDRKPAGSLSIILSIIFATSGITRTPPIVISKRVPHLRILKIILFFHWKRFQILDVYRAA